MLPQALLTKHTFKTWRINENTMSLMIKSYKFLYRLKRSFAAAFSLTPSQELASQAQSNKLNIQLSDEPVV